MKVPDFPMYRIVLLISRANNMKTLPIAPKYLNEIGLHILTVSQRMEYLYSMFKHLCSINCGVERLIIQSFNSTVNRKPGRRLKPDHKETTSITRLTCSSARSMVEKQYGENRFIFNKYPPPPLNPTKSDFVMITRFNIMW